MKEVDRAGNLLLIYAIHAALPSFAFEVKPIPFELPEMRTRHPKQLTLVHHFFLICILVVTLLATLAELSAGFLSKGAGVAKANVETVSASNSISTYTWNLEDAGLPLLDLPDHIKGSVDLSLTYSMGQFQFPLFQSLYYNERVGKYILMVMPKDAGRAEFIDLTAGKNRRQFEAKGNLDLRLEDKGSAKFLTTSGGTVYTFVQFGNGEFHCTRIRDRGGVVIDLKYTDEVAIDTIVDVSGRTINFSYEKNSLRSITQTWGRGSKNKQTWAIADAPIRQQVAHFVTTGVKRTKRIPTNAPTPAYTHSMAASDLMLATIFGDQGAVAAANAFEPAELGSQYPLYRGDLIGDDGKLRRGHLSYAMHLYGSANGTADTAVYIPTGYISHSSTPTPTDAAVTFYYPRLGNLTNVTLAVFHISNFGLTIEGERVRIGNIGGRGGSIACYKHAHIEFYRGDTGLPPAAARARLRIDPTTVFETSLDIGSRATSGVAARTSLLTKTH